MLRTAVPLVLALVAAPAAAAGWSVDEGSSVFAVLTRPAGAGAKLAHPHLVVARGVKTTLEFDGKSAESARFTLSAPVLSLDVDPTAERKSLAARLETLGAHEGALPPIGDGDRKKIRKSMLEEGQLAAERFPAVRAELVALERRGGGEGARVALGWNARVRIEVRGKTVEKTFPARWELEGGELRAEVLGEAKFTEFGIEPYSAFLGAIRNADLFHFYVRLVARRTGD
ncbi:MAG TPA: hypothetical protein VI942_08760 [Thermoanaerobaculia bacterium]|nr:hypothetical protein [Thermoanaerobaculia bacterium]